MVEIEEKDEKMSDSEDESADNGLSAAIRRLDRTQHIRSTGRSGVPSAGKGLGLKGLLRTLGDTAAHAEVGRALKAVRKHKTTLPIPLEKREAEKIKRSTGFEEIKVKLDRWNAIVSRNRSAEHKQFPLLSAEDKQREPIGAHFSNHQIQSELEKDLNVLDPLPETPEEKKFPLTMAEMIEHRKEAAKLRARQSYKEAKARRQSKIKSKKFHRVLRKEKIKTQLKEFEDLQKTNPEEALRKLELLEKTRAEERVTLRHKSTGHWAKNKLIRAKYNKEARQELAQQLAISKELTQKLNINNDAESDDEAELADQVDLKDDPSNPWLQPNKDPNDYSDFVSGYKKYWDEHNKNDKSNNIEHSTDLKVVKPEARSVKEQEINDDKKKSPSKKKRKKESSAMKEKAGKMKKMLIAHSTSEWDVSDALSKLKTTEKTSFKEDVTIDNMFDELDSTLKDKAAKKIKSLKEKSNRVEKKTSKRNNSDKIYDEFSKLSFKSNNNRPIIDEALNESLKDDGTDITNDKYSYLNKTKIDPATNKHEVKKVDPNKFVAPKPRHLLSALPDGDIGEDYLDDEEDVGGDNKMTIAEAFLDDDIVADFQQEKDAEIKNAIPQVDDSFLPGWGSWTGKNMAAPKRKKRRIFFTASNPRKDHKKDNVIIKEEVNTKIKPHLVSELPYPFTSVSDFEASIRAPIGSTFIPETAHKKLTKPSVTIKTGIIITPMDESQLIDKKNMKKKLMKLIS